MRSVLLILGLSALGGQGGCGRSPEGWLRLGDELDGSTVSDAATLRRAADAYQRACDGGNLDGCYHVTVFHAGRVGFPPNEPRARELLEATCQKGHLKSCSFLGDLFFQGTGVESLSRAAELHRRACDGGELRGCTGLANGVGQGLGVAYDARLDAELRMKACSGGDYYACLGLGLPKSWRPRPLSPAALVTELARECDGSTVDACDGLGLMLLHGLGAPRDPAAAMVRFERARKTSFVAAAHLGFVLEKGLSGAPDLARADQLYREACNGRNGDALGCVLQCKSGRGDAAELRRVCLTMCRRGAPETCAVP